MAQKKYAPAIPLTTDRDNNIVNIDDALANCTQLLKMIVLTNPGEKLMDPQFGCGIRKLIFENQAKLIDEGIEKTINYTIKSQVSAYASDIIVGHISAMFDNNTLYISIPYNYRGYFFGVAAIEVGLQG